MRKTGMILGLVLMVALAACGPQKFKDYSGPQVTQIQVYKSQRVLYLLHDNQIVKTYKVYLGFNPVGPKHFEGDGKTPEGLYYINRRNPKSAFYLSLGISYPNETDVEVARKAGKNPGGDIFIHGEPNESKKSGDWTTGCIAMTDKEMRDIYAMVPEGTPIFIFP